LLLSRIGLGTSTPRPRLSMVCPLLLYYWLIQNADYPKGQCGGTGYSGQSQCPAGASCQYNNPYYYQCLPGSAGSPSTTAANTPIPSTTVQTTASPPAAGGSQTLYGPCGGMSVQILPMCGGYDINALCVIFLINNNHY